MTIHSPQFAVALTHVLKGVARFTTSGAAGQKKTAPGRGTFRSLSEGHRRTRVLEMLHREYATHPAATDPDPADLTTVPPDAWVNTRLSNLREPWRVHNVDGFRCEIYDVR